MATQKSPLRRVEPEAHRIEDAGDFPNNPQLPALIYRGAFTLPREGDAAAIIERVLGDNGWQDGWRNGIYDVAHYHSTAHEVLGCYAGHARVQLGGSEGPVVEIVRGDVLVVPAGVSHQNLGATEDFRVVGAYPDGQDHDMMYGRGSERPAADERIASVPLPERDPLYGADGPLVGRWRGRT